MPPARIVAPGKAPQKRTESIESFTSYNGVPVTVIWSHSAISSSPQPPPRTSIQIYDTTSTAAASPAASRQALAKTLESSVFGPNDTGYSDRLDIYSLSVPETVEEERRVELCIGHQKAELLRRRSAVGGGGGGGGGGGEQDRLLFMQDSYRAKQVILHHRFLIIIDCLPERWEEDEGGGMLFVFFDPVEPDVPTEPELDEWGNLEVPEEKEPEVVVRRVKGLRNVKLELDNIRRSMEFNRLDGDDS
ncbi:MAG: hypothetical protein MMC33_005889 [Icmadophila ericetorum]|nr:hypothetical protein [Icmadophila ericetorum]